jgi:eukaryotic-like serine/threonine-protein kinase
VSEYVRGRALDELDRPLPWRKVLELALDLTRGLAAAHRCGVLHRDVKPANAVLAEDGRAKLLDFGLARVTDGSEPIIPVAPPRERTTVHRHLAAIDTTAVARRVVTPPREDSTWDVTGPGAAVDDSPSPPLEGTPLYMAPELWRGDPASRRSDLYSLGILLYELLSGVAPHRGIPIADLGEAVQERDVPRLEDVVRGIDPAVAAIVDRLVERDAGARFASADELLIALEEAAAPPVAEGVPDGNPYRGLAAFETQHGSLFFGRRGEIRELVDRVRAEPFVVVGGDSGTGKSSLCRAGVLPWLVDNDGWSRIDVVPGRHPVRSLAAALAGWWGADEAAIVALLRDSADEFSRALRRQAGPRRLLLFVDQLEELLTLSEPVEARAVAGALAALAVRAPSVRVLATGRSDFLSRLAMLPGLGDEMARALYFLRPLAGDRIREVIVRPAAVKGVGFESEELVDTLVAQAEQAPGGLPLLSFTLAELWDTRDVEAKTIRADALAAIGGVEGSLTRHADRVLAGLDATEREAARRILLRLVTADGTRARRAEAELLTDGAERAALEVLVRGRIVVANDAQHGAYELAHEALLTSWSTLQGWLQRGAADQVVRERVEHAAAVWDSAGRSRDLLWGRRQLAETAGLDHDAMAPRDVEFLAAGKRAVVRRRVIGASTAAVVAIAAIAIGLTIRARARRELETVISNEVRAAADAAGAARELAKQRDVARDRAFQLFDTQHWTEGEDMWDRVEALAEQEATQYRDASSHLESALSLDTTRTHLREQFADLLFERLVRAGRDRRGDLTDELAARLAAYDGGRRRAQLGAAAHVELEIEPRGTRVWTERPNAPRELLGEAPLPPLALPPGSLVLAFEAPGRVAARLPLLLAGGESIRQRVALPETASAPPGMIYVPAGRFLFGSADASDLRRSFLNTAPLHEARTGAYYIARNEVTFAQWIEFLEELGPEERRKRAPSASTPQSALALVELAPRHWRLTLTPTTHTYTAETTQRFRYQGRSRRGEQDWLKFPVAAVSFEDAVAFAAWLDRTGRVRGARLCDDYEWERAARGADGRMFPTGTVLAPDDANIDVTYGREPLAFGPDEIGSHPQSRSPVGAEDMAGNVWEWTRSVETIGAPVARGGAWYNNELSSRSYNREYGEPTQRHVLIGVRLCATPM